MVKVLKWLKVVEEEGVEEEGVHDTWRNLALKKLDGAMVKARKQNLN